MTKNLFWLALILILYPYAGYPLLLWVQTRLKKKKSGKRPQRLFVTVIISVLNEERTILARLGNLNLQTYPAELVEIIIVSDGSTDGTCELVTTRNQANVTLLTLPQRQGKAAALNYAMAHARGEIVVYADARQNFAPDVLAELTANFADPQVGCVSGELLLVKDGESQIQVEMGAYWTYEKWIRKMESQTGSVIGATGAIYAIRRSLFKPLPIGTILDDVLTPLNVIAQGYRTLFDNNAVAYDKFSKDVSQEWRRKVRTLAGNWQLLSLQPTLLLPWRNPCWWRFVSHKIMRLLVPLALGILLVSSLCLYEGIYQIVAVLQLFFYGIALAGALIPATRKNRLISLCYFFLVMNTATAVGYWQWLTGRSAMLWKPGR